MIRTLFALLVLIIWGCRHDGYNQTGNERGESCSVSESGRISCPDGTNYQIPSGSPGPAGEVGPSGEAGHDGIDGVNGVPGRDGQSIVGPRGSQGEPGTAGAIGPAGRDGTSCTVSDTGLITCGDTSYQIPAGSPGPQGPAGNDGVDGAQGPSGQDGKDGEDGTNGAPGTVVYPVFPCPTLSGSYPEVLLCIADKLYAVFDPSTGTNNIRYVQVGPGSYVTTDGRACQFRVVSGCVIE